MDKLLEMTQKFPQTHYWNDSCSLSELEYAIKRGAVGATTNPVIVRQVLENDLDSYRRFIENTVSSNPFASENQIAWLTMEKMAADGARLLLPVFDPIKGIGRLSIQTNIRHFRNSEKLIQQTMHLSSIAPNIQIKIPATSAGLDAIEECTFRGASINATVSFSATQAAAAAEKAEEGLRRRRREGLECSGINPVITIMVGRLDDWLKYVVQRDKRTGIEPEALDWAGIACAKKALRIFREKKYSSKLLIAAYRHEGHWTQFIGGDLFMTIPHKYQVMFNRSGTEIRSRIDEPVPGRYLEQLLLLEDFRKAYENMDVNGFDSYGPVNRTLDQFSAGYDELVLIIRKFLIRY